MITKIPTGAIEEFRSFLKGKGVKLMKTKLDERGMYNDRLIVFYKAAGMEDDYDVWYHSEKVLQDLTDEFILMHVKDLPRSEWPDVATETTISVS